MHDETLSNGWIVVMEVNNSIVDFKLDTGAQVNVLPKAVFDKLTDRTKLLPNNVQLSSYSNNELNVCGRSVLSVRLRGKIYKVLFYIVDTDRVPLLGLSTCIRLNLINRIDQVELLVDDKKSRIARKYADLFDEIGVLNRVYHMELKNDAVPQVSPTKRLPFSMHDKVSDEIQRMIRIGVVEKVISNEPSEWLNTLVVVEKPDGNVRLCLDPRNLNKVIKREYFQLPTTESIIGKMNGTMYFSKLDASSGYWQIKVDEETSKYLTFMTPWGRYRFLRLPFGVHSASEIFQSEIAQILSGLEGADNSQDDIVVWGKSEEEHDERLFKVLERIRASGLKLNLKKCEICKHQITFLGHIISAHGVKPDDRKIRAIRDMPVPSSKVEVQRFLGMVTYLGKFIPHLATITSPLRLLLQKDVIFSMEKPQIEAVDTLKRLLTSDTVLKFYNPNLPLRIRSDASLEGLGAVLQQKHGDDWYPVAYASRSLTSTEKAYASIEKETLSVVFGCERFHEYVYGRNFVVQNDHQALQSIFKKPITSCPLRIQRFFLRLQRYDFSFEYNAGSTMKVSDCLSRAPLTERHPEISENDMKYFIHSIISSLPVSNRKWNELKIETARDETLCQLKSYIENGWPKIKATERRVAPYRSIRDELSIHDGVVLKGSRIIVPTNMRKSIKVQLHTGHMGIEKCLNRAKVSVYWPNINKELEDVVSNCSSCITHRNALQKESLIEHEIPDYPWVKVGIDLFSLYNNKYVIAVDYNSKFVEVAPLRNETAICVVNNVKNIFGRFGLPKTIFSDNGSQFTSRDFKDFVHSWDLIHDSSSPEYPKSNGFIERHIQTVKNVLLKSHDNNDDPYLALLALNTTPDGEGQSPASRMFSRHPRTLLPTMQKQKTSKVVRRSNSKKNTMNIVKN